ncbi:MAG: glycosyltransferase family 2 protein [Paludibacteraceae bacterium]|nr:glycosyltransferase family 2 protein [Paludibacteraceae bacterium]
MQPKVSVIIPVYNVEKKLLCKCLDSLLNQTLKEIELVCVLDCPTDGTDKVVDEYAQKDTRIKIVRNEHNLHIGESRNRGIEAATGEFIGFFDDDDYCEPTMYKELYDSALLKNCNYSFCGRSIINNKTGEDVSLKEPNKYNIIECLNSIVKFKFDSNTVIWNKIIKKDLITDNNIKFIDTKRMSGEDQLFNCKILLELIKSGGNIYYTEKKLYHHLLHKNNTGISESYIEGLLQFRDSLSELLLESDISSTTNQNKNLAEGTIATIYKIFRYRLKKRGIISAFTLLKDIRQYNSITKNLKEYKFQYNKDITIVKNIISWIIKTVFLLSTTTQRR